MIVHPRKWADVGKPIVVKQIEDTIMDILTGINCNCLALSGGLDSSLILYYLSKIHVNIFTFTIGISEKHPDVIFSERMVRQFSNIEHKVYIPTPVEIMDESHYKDQDHAVRLFYKFVRRYTESIISCDGIDEYMCGYYSHQESPGEEMYHYCLKRLQEDHLSPLNKNSADVHVYLPYIDERLTVLLSQIPTYDKVDKFHRKKIMVQMAKGHIPEAIINRRKYGFCDALKIKQSEVS